MSFFQFIIQPETIVSASFCCHRFPLRWICLQSATLQPGDIYIYIFFLLIYICIYSHCSPTQADMPNSFASQKTHMYICEKTNLQNRAATGNTLSSKANTHASLRGFLPRGTCAAVTYRRNVDTFVFSSFSLSQSRFCGRASSATLSHSDGPACKTPCCRSNPASSS